ncbi:tRNA(fMet)-specific endonuclease VapC [archaeon HR01]|nr:tRNA(fMet)-specific endonuclease VapC [archaeon HR01]
MALLSGFVEYGPAELMTVSEVVDEVRYGGLAPERLMAAIESGLVVVREARPETVLKVLDAAAETGDRERLSKADIHLIALALEEHEKGSDVTIISDDYSIQNTASYMGLKVRGGVRPTIKKVVRWFSICVGCGYQSSSIVEKCPRCGGEMVRKSKTLDNQL